MNVLNMARQKKNQLKQFSDNRKYFIIEIAILKAKNHTIHAHELPDEYDEVNSY